MLALAYVVLAGIVSFVIGANNSANSVGALYGSEITGYTKAALLSGFFVMLGAVLEGWKMSGAIGGGVVATTLSLTLSLVVLITTLILLFIFTALSMPLSASQIMIGAIVGVAIFSGIFINVTFLVFIAISWFATFISGIALAYVIYLTVYVIADRLHIFALSRFYAVSLYIGAAFIAYTLGANTIGLIASLTGSEYYIYLMAGLSAFAGTILLGKRTVNTVGKKITILDPPRAFAALFAGAVIVEIFTQLHLPVSMTQAVIGGVIGTGFVKGYHEINKTTVKNLALSWIFAPLLSFVMAYIIMDAILLL